MAYARAYHSNEWCSHPLVDDWRRILRDPANSQVDPVMGNLVVGLRYASEEVHVSESDPTFPQSVDIEDLCSGTCLSKKCNPECCLGGEVLEHHQKVLGRQRLRPHPLLTEISRIKEIEECAYQACEEGTCLQERHETWMAVVVYSTLSPLRRTLKEKNGDESTDAPTRVHETNDDSDSDGSNPPKRDLASEFEQAAAVPTQVRQGVRRNTPICLPCLEHPRFRRDHG